MGKSTIGDGVRLGCGMFIILPLIIIGVLILLVVISGTVNIKPSLSVVAPKTVSQASLNNFPFKNVILKDTGFGSIDAMGELTNNSGKDYHMITFTMSLYDKNEALLGSNAIILVNFLNGQTKTFDTIILDTDYKSVTKYKIQYETGY